MRFPAVTAVTGVTAVTAVLAVALLSGCAATQVAIEKRNLDVQTRMSATIFLDPVPADEQTVFVQLRNTSDKPELDVTPELVAALTARGWRVVGDPRLARFYLQANVLQVGKTDPSALRLVTGSAFGAAIVGGAAGLTVANATVGGIGPGNRAAAGAAVAGGITELVVGSLVKDVYFSIITDVQIKERLPEGRLSAVDSSAINVQGTTGSNTVRYAERSDMRTYQTRVVSTANKVNLDFEEAAPALRAGLMRALAGLF